MSHFTVMVIRNKGCELSVHDMLAPYDENIRVAPYVYKTKEQLIADMIKEAHEWRSYPGVKEYFEKRAAGTREPDNYYELKDKLYEKVRAGECSDEELYKIAIDEGGYSEDEIDRDGNVLSTYNPNSKWDWYEVGGRWNNMIPLKDGKTVNRALSKEIDWDKLYKLEEKDLKKYTLIWKHHVMDEPIPEDMPEKEQNMIKFCFYSPEYYKERYGTLEQFLHDMAQFQTHAVLTTKGWFESGEMGWFGCSSATADDEKDWTKNFYDRFVKDLPDDAEITIIDCHI